MSVELYFNNIRNLEKSLGLSGQIELDSSLSATLVSNHSKPLILNISYDFEEETILIKTFITTHFPKSRIGIQTVMNQLIGDLLVQNKEVGRLVANPNDYSIEFVKAIDLKNATESTLASFVPLFTQSAMIWRDKFDQVTKEKQEGYFSHENEILNFNML